MGVGEGGGENPSCVISSVNYFKCRIYTEPKKATKALITVFDNLIKSDTGSTGLFHHHGLFVTSLILGVIGTYKPG